MEDHDQRSAEALAYFVLLRRLFTELARMREPGFLEEQSMLAHSELVGLSTGEPGVAFDPLHLAAAGNIVDGILAGIEIRRSPEAS